jgi:hypothetical protein
MSLQVVGLVADISSTVSQVTLLICIKVASLYSGIIKTFHVIRDYFTSNKTVAARSDAYGKWNITR